MDGALITGLIDNVLVLATASFAVVQLREMNAQSRATSAATRGQVYQSLTSAMLDIDHLFIQQPSLRPYFYDGRSIPDDAEERQRVMATAELLCDFFDDCTAQSHLLDEMSVKVWLTYAQSIARTSPAVRLHWTENRDWYSARLHGVLDDVVAACSAHADRRAPATRSAVAAG